MSTKLFVASLPWATDDAALRELFERVGDVVEAKVITDRETGRSRGFGFVTFEDPDDARSAVESLDGHEIDGRSIRVDWARDNGKRKR